VRLQRSSPAKEIEAAAAAPYPLAVNLAVNGVWLSDVPHLLTVLDQAYDFSNGELTSRLRFEGGGDRGGDRGPDLLLPPPADLGGTGGSWSAAIRPAL